MTTATKTRPAITTPDANRLANGQLRLQIGSRLRLSDEDRQTLKDAYRSASASEAPTETTNHNGLVISTRVNTPVLNKQLGMDSMTFSSVIASREPLPLALILKFQDVLKVDLVSPAYLTDCFNDYISHLKNVNEELK